MEVAEADFLEEGEALGDFWDDVSGDEFFAWGGEFQGLEVGGGFVDGEVGEVGDGGGKRGACLTRQVRHLSSCGEADGGGGGVDA